MELPIYNAIINEQCGDGIYAISLVDCPAVERDFIAFGKNEKPEFKFEINEQMEHCITGVIMLADTPIYRYSPEIGEYYIRFDKDTIKKMSELMLQYGSHNNIDLQHDENYFWGKCNLVECYIKDSAKGVNHTAFTDIPDGSLIATYKVHDVDLWDKIMSGEVKGFSLEGYFNYELNFNKQDKKEKTLMNKIKEMLKQILVAMGTVTTKDGKEIEFDGETLEIGVAVSVEDGNYELEDGKILVVKDGKVEEIKDKEEEPTEEPKPEEPKEEKEELEEEEETPEEEEEPTEEPTEEPEDDIEALKAEIEALKEEVEKLKEDVKTLINTPVVEPVVEEFKKIENRSLAQLMDDRKKNRK